MARLFFWRESEWGDVGVLNNQLKNSFTLSVRLINLCQLLDHSIHIPNGIPTMSACFTLYIDIFCK